MVDFFPKLTTQLVSKNPVYMYICIYLTLFALKTNNSCGNIQNTSLKKKSEKTNKKQNPRKEHSPVDAVGPASFLFFISLSIVIWTKNIMVASLRTALIRWGHIAHCGAGTSHLTATEVGPRPITIVLSITIQPITI